jgi:hypothetical protein
MKASHTAYEVILLNYIFCVIFNNNYGSLENNLSTEGPYHI